MPTQEQIRTAVDAYVQSFRDQDRSAFIAALADDVEQEDPVGSAPNLGRETLGGWWDGLFNSAQRIEFDAREVFVAGDEAAMVFTIVQHLRDGGTVTIDGVDTFRVDDEGRIASVRGYGAVRS